MKTIINRLISEAGLEFINVDPKLDFAYYEEKDDFFLLLFYNYQDILQITDNNIRVLEYALNTLVVNTKESEILSRFKERNINYNLSIILFVDLDTEYPLLFQEFNKAEENYINAKKYILPYHGDVLANLKERISETDNVAQTLNELAISHSDAISQIEEQWYDLLLNLFIKIPFLNYKPADHSLAIDSLSDSISETLSQREASLLAIINDSNIAAVTDIENFAFNKNMIDNGTI
ncbi:hypothetical protein [Flavobacterium subsaxonicum]|uniref:Uncharacterized protein n=1 Tax=Flavobacterium subsaxonicum WB 4.1-42 = DSM 21790 TaxID=1121898 RepID=A0A0A2MZR3_9FLAO|nr:hypothetical protein [Flavobacterium subsaxonicum]KGO93690.1 hypothetical protein Q766_06945 [Flavobacterium subsaxonicum WB 4.1-42 = DSM 21790]